MFNFWQITEPDYEFYAPAKAGIANDGSGSSSYIVVDESCHTFSVKRKHLVSNQSVCLLFESMILAVLILQK